MAASREDLGGSKVRLHVEVPADTFKENIEKAYRKDKGKYTVQGFRKGKAPRSVIETHYGDRVFYGTAFSELFDKALQGALAETGTEYTGIVADTISIQDWGRDLGVVFEVEVWTVPEVKLGELEGLEAKRSVYTYEDDLIDDLIEVMRNESERWIHKEGAAEWGDRVIADYIGTVEGVPFPGGTAKDVAFILGRHGSIGNFEEQLKGVKAGDDVQVHVQLPDLSTAGEFRGKMADFDVHVKEVFSREIPELNDDFAADVSEYDTLEDFRENIRREVQETHDRGIEGAIESKLIEEVSKRSEAILPPPLVEREIDEELNYMIASLALRGVKFDDYLAGRGLTKEQIRELHRPGAEAQVKERAVIRALLEKFDLYPTKDNRDDYLVKAAQDENMSVEDFTAKLSESERESVVMQVAVAMMLAKLKEMANITEVPDEAARAQMQMQLENRAKAYKIYDENPVARPQAEAGADAENQPAETADAQAEAEADTQEEAQSFTQAVEDAQDVAEAMVEAAEESGGQLPGEEPQSEPATDA